VKQETADTILRLLDEHGWGQATGAAGSWPPGAICLGMAASAAVGDSMALMSGGRADPVMWQLQRVIRDHFPGRMRASETPLGVVARFNDNPATGREDVSLVVKHAVDGP
jgi:hypothetical protein